MPVDEALDLVGADAAARPLSVAAVGRRAAARGHRPRHRQAARRCCCATSRPARSTTQTGKLVLEVIARINRELGTTAIVITHNAAIAGMADRVVYLGDGRIQRIESPTRDKADVRAELVLVRHEGARPQAAARPAADVEPGADDRAGGGQRHRRLRHQPVGGGLAGARRATASTPSGRFADVFASRQARARTRSPTRWREVDGVADVQTTRRGRSCASTMPGLARPDHRPADRPRPRASRSA